MDSPCDLWEGNCINDGYGRLHIDRIDGKQIQILAHRLVWLQTFGHTDLSILHSCDTPACVNIEHLRAGTHQENMRDMRERGRQRNQTKTHCKQGHKFDEENTRWDSPTRRRCKTCNSRRSLEKYYRNKEHSLTQ